MKLRVAEYQNSSEQAASASIILGGTSKIVASCITYPYQVIKSRIQQRGVGSQYFYTGVVDCVTKTWKQEGVRGFFRGLIPNAMKVAPSSALTFVVYEEVLKLQKRNLV
jgi:solute carrier family 25 (mitochondrial folate transporter), member 32